MADSHTTITARIAGIPIDVARSSATAPSSRWTDEQRQNVAGLAGDVAAGSMRGAAELAQRALDSTASLESSRWAASARSLAIVAGIMTDKAQLLSGQPTTRAERVDTAELTERLHRLLGMRASLEVPSLELEQPDS